ncbi:Protein kintoun [Nibea albiflora]|uniref:Protein kintoun n=1 Tax=Nibea albiflora TaxID=240163 RepID=A0ACB7FGU5_NIBAL|nr:Protein kintoun [Nibea albiflora]
MEVGDKLKELNMTVDEMDRLTKAFRDEKFREMLREYAEELSDPENKKMYEEEIKLLEQERGNTVEFIHPEPFRALRTSVNGKQKCFINICGNEKLGKPSSRWGVSDEGRRGQCWSLPHSLHPGKQDTDPKGNKIMIYDVVFHPDTLHIASKNKRFMDMVDSTAIQGIQKAFNVTLDKNNVREMSTKYKGTPNPCVIRKPTPGYEAKAPSEKPDPLAFPYPDEKRPVAPSQTKPTGSPVTEKSSEAEPKSFQVQSQKAKEPTRPNCTVKYRSFIDLQDFRCSRDSAQSPRPKEIVVTIDVPLLKAVRDASLEVKETRLLLESKNPAYRLELPLAYPVDEDKGEAKFNRQRGQLTVTLPVLPSKEYFAVGPDQTGGSDDERQEEKSEAEEDEKCQETEREDPRHEVERDAGEDLKQQTRVENGEEERGQEKGEGQVREGENSKEEETGVEEEREWKKQIQKDHQSVEEENVKEQKQENEREVGKSNLQKRQRDEDKWICEPNKSSEDEGDRAAERKDGGVTGFHCRNVDRSLENSRVAAPETEKQPVLITAELPSRREKAEEVNLNSCLEPTPKTRTSDIKEEAEKTKENLKVETDAALAADTQSQDVKDRCTPQGTQESSKMTAADEANKSSGGGSGNLSSEEPPPVILREIDTDGNEEIISDHSTSAGFVFQNSLMFELD